VEECGGHQPWRHSIFFFDRRRDRFYSLDDAIGPITAGFEIETADTITTQARFVKKETKGVQILPGPADDPMDRNVSIDLHWLAKHMPSKAVSSNAKDRALKRRAEGD